MISGYEAELGFLDIHILVIESGGLSSMIVMLLVPRWRCRSEQATCCGSTARWMTTDSSTGKRTASAASSRPTSSKTYRRRTVDRNDAPFPERHDRTATSRHRAYPRSRRTIANDLGRRKKWLHNGRSNRIDRRMPM